MTAVLDAPAAAPARPRPRPPGPRPVKAGGIGNVALAGLTLGATVGLARLFTRPAEFLWPVAAVAVVAHTVAWACRRARLNLPVSAVAVTAASLLAMSWVILGSSTAYGIPWHGTAHAARIALSHAADAYRSTAAPTAVLPGFTLASAFGAVVAAFLSDWAAFRMRATTEACLPSFSLFVLSAALAQGHGEAIAGAAWLGALLGFLLVRQAAVDGPSTAWFASRNRSGPVSVISGGVLLAAATVLFAVSVGPHLPGATTKPLVNWRQHTSGNGDRNIGTSPLVDITARLQSLSHTEVFTVASTVPAYWRLTSLDTFNGTGWSLNDVYVAAGHRLGGDTATPDLGPSKPVRQTVNVSSLSSIWLPAAYRPAALSGVGGVSVSADAGSLITKKATSNGMAYAVTSNVPTATPAELDAAPPVEQGDPALTRYLQLPDTVPLQVRRIAEAVTARATTPYAQAKALQDYLRSPPFRYDLNVGADDSSNALLDFLTKSHAGFCQQYAASFAVMAREIGLPTRVAVGFTEGDLQKDGLYHVTDAQAHAWPEVYFQGIGWIAFEPTPTRGSPDPSAEAITGAPPGQSTAAATPSSAAPGATAPGAAAAQDSIPKSRGANNAGTGASTNAHRGTTVLSNPIVAVTATGAGVSLVWVGTLAGAAALVTLLRRRRATNPNRAVRLAWLEATEGLAVVPLPSETPSEYSRRASRIGSLPDDAIGALTDLRVSVEHADYAPGGAGSGHVDAARSASQRVRSAATANRQTNERLLRLLDPRPLLQMLRNRV